MSKALVNSSGKVLLRDGKVATSDAPSCCCAASGACCVDGVCSILTEAACTTAEGNYQGDDTVCADDSCVGACCHEDDSCEILSEAACNDISGATYHGNGSVCDPNPCATGTCCTIQSIRLQGSITGTIDCSPCDGFGINCSFDHTWIAGTDFGVNNSCQVDVAVNNIDASGCITCPGDETETCGFNLSVPWGSYDIGVVINSGGTVQALIQGLLLGCGAFEGDNACTITGGTGFFSTPAWLDPSTPNGVYEFSDNSDPTISYNATLTVDAVPYSELNGSITLGGTAYVAGCFSDCLSVQWQAYPLSGGTTLETNGIDNDAESDSWFTDSANCSVVESSAGASVECTLDEDGHPQFALRLSVIINGIGIDYLAPECLAGDARDSCGDFGAYQFSRFSLANFNTDPFCDLGYTKITLGSSPFGTFEGTLDLAYQDPDGPCQAFQDCSVDWPCCSPDSPGRGTVSYSITIS
jgi:hypothetical protein